ncbi:MAG: hypothetical protein U1E50_15115 [Caulobacteraceae bacterium]
MKRQQQTFWTRRVSEARQFWRDYLAPALVAWRGSDRVFWERDHTGLSR